MTVDSAIEVASWLRSLAWTFDRLSRTAEPDVWSSPASDVWDRRVDARRSLTSALSDRCLTASGTCERLAHHLAESAAALALAREVAAGAAADLATARVALDATPIRDRAGMATVVARRVESSAVATARVRSLTVEIDTVADDLVRSVCARLDLSDLRPPDLPSAGLLAVASSVGEDRRRSALAGVTPELAAAIVASDPDRVLAMAGVPHHVRFTAATASLQEHIGTIDRRIAAIRMAVASHGGSAGSAAIALAAAVALRVRMTRWLEEGRTLWDVDVRGDGRVVEVFGDLATAESVAVIVPGMSNSLHGYDANLRVDAMALAAQVGPGSAVIAWLGYDTPGWGPIPGLSVLTSDRARGAAADLAAFIADLDLDQSVNLTIIGHSYGSLVAATAAVDAPIDDLVLIGSPGVDVGHADELAGATRVWAATADNDLIVAVSSFTAPAGVVDSDGDLEFLHFGRNPTHRDFGAAEIPAGSAGHDGYFTGASLVGLGAIVTGHRSPKTHSPR